MPHGESLPASDRGTNRVSGDLGQVLQSTAFASYLAGDS